MSTLPEQQPGPPPAGRPGLRRAVDLAIRVVGGVVAVVAAAATAVLELILSTLRVGGVLIGVSVLVTVLANAALGWFAPRAVGRRWALALPAGVWFAVMVVAAGGTSEGDILIAGNNWVGIAMIFAGSVTFAVVGFRMIMSPRGPDSPLLRP
ncbi:hypothetical protein ACN27G_36145 [Plantactinospora sp. WMMB334]|uniref:hypothetical protein n=1 Tax=Plantactinospora sp. WMMB334 TaxID=3404119 RepID=UPI003B93E63A